MTSTPMRFTTHLAPFFFAVFLTACGKKDQPFTPPPPEVGVQVVEERAAPIDLTYMARVAGVREVEVRARVSGILLRRQYKEGSRVKEGDLLFRIDPAPYQAEVARLRAQLGVEQASFQEARRQCDRVIPLVDKGLVSRREADQTLAAFESAEAAVAAANAALKRAELDLSYTEVRAPISGLTSRETRSEGSLVAAADSESNLLTRIVQTDQLYIDFSMAAAEAALVRQALETHGKPLQVTALTADGKPLPDSAELTFIDTAIDQGSGTVQARATLRNQKDSLVPGQFLRARIEGVALPKSTVIPARAVLRSPMGAMVWVVGAGDKVEPRPVQLGDTTANDVAVLGGLKSGERVIIDGVIKVQPGAVVKPVVIDDQPENAAAAPKPPAGAPAQQGPAHTPDGDVAAPAQGPTHAPDAES